VFRSVIDRQLGRLPNFTSLKAKELEGLKMSLAESEDFVLLDLMLSFVIKYFVIA
jgi:hypothetical protein